MSTPFRSSHPWLACGLALVPPLAGAADATPVTPLRTAAAAESAGAATLQALRDEVAALRAVYETRLRALEERLQAAERQAAGAVPPATAVGPRPAPAPSAAGLAVAAPPPVAGAMRTDAAFNPAIALILSGQYGRASRDPAGAGPTGFVRATEAEVGVATRGFSLGESELGFAASIDPFWRGQASVALHGDDSLSVEEAYVETTSLGRGLTLRAGRFLSGVGYLNAKHAHSWDFADMPLPYQAMLGTQLRDDGVQLRWLAPTATYLEFAAELGRGGGLPASASARNGAGLGTLAVHAGGDVGDNADWRAGLSWLHARADGQALSVADRAGTTLGGVLDGRTRVWVVDAVWKWAPGGNAARHGVTLQGELVRSQRGGRYTGDAIDWRAAQTGWYVQGVVQFMPRWRLGLRGDGLSAGSADPGVDAAYRPRRATLMLDHSPSEFSRLRLQLASDRTRAGASDTQWLLQYQMSLGAHGGHAY